ncbi:MAG TPA: GGDEF domain-containing protein, partial [Pseudomonadales bacterium]|nr:GGDEF domain-containing protein [Pseudomonadales bacterium]
AAGMVLMGATLLGIILLDRRVVLFAFCSAFLTLFTLNAASAWGWLPYAPALVPPGNVEEALFWTHSALFFSLPNLTIIVGAVAFLLQRWRQRELDILALSLTDPLTHLHNRRSILQLLEQEVARSQRHGTSLAIAMLDLDHFKRINDTWGHLLGDRVLLLVAETLTQTLKPCDMIGRIGGEEFLLLLPNTHTDEAVQLLHQCRAALENLALRAENGDPVPIRGSFGLACNEFTEEVEASVLLRAADEALYRAKLEGRNRVELAAPANIWDLVKTTPAPSHKTSLRASHTPVHDRWPQLPDTPADKTSASPIRFWHPRLSAVLEWSPLTKSMLVLGWLTATLVGSNLWLSYLLQSNGADIIRPDIATRLQWSNSALLTMTLTLIVFGYSMRRRMTHAKLFLHLVLQLYGLTMLTITFTCGLLSMATGLMLITSPLMGLILFEPVVVWWGFGTAMTAMVALAYASALGWLPYAPLLVDDATRYTMHTPFWMVSNYVFLLLQLTVMLLFADHLLTRRREREAHVQRLSRTDALTNVHNRRSILNLLAKEVARTLHHGPPLAVVLLDLDHFKRINDTWGHQAGDLVLSEAAAVLSQTVRQSDAVGRYGGEEFLLLLTDTSLEGAKALVERCRVRLAETRIDTGHGDSFSFSASFGIASNEHCLGLTSSALLKAADTALYRAKQNGRNRVEATAMPLQTPAAQPPLTNP